MDPTQFDRLTRALSSSSSRRVALGAMLGGLLTPLLPDALGADRQRDKKNRDKNQNRHKSKNNGKDRGKDKKAKATGKDKKQKQRERKRTAASSEAAAGCCSSGNCAPGTSKNLTRCCYEGQTLNGKSFKSSNLTRANFRGSDLTNAKFQSSNLTGACFVDATMTGANFNGANLSGVIRCRTITGSGRDDSGCHKGTVCCPTCDALHLCESDQVCCNGRCMSGECCGTGGQSTCGSEQLCCDSACVTGNCCSEAQCDDPAAPICVDYTCSPCSDDAQCEHGLICCDGVCAGGMWANQTTFGSPGPGPSQLSQPVGVALSPDGLTVWVAEYNVDRISVWTRPTAGSTAWTHQTTFGSTGSGFSFPTGVAIPADGLTACVADSFNHRISVWTRPNIGSTAWSEQTTFGSEGTDASEFVLPFGVAVSADGLTVWVGDQGNNRVSIWTRPNAGSTNWTIQTTFGSGGSGDGEFSALSGVAVSADELTVWVADTSNDRISVWTRPDASSTAWTHLINFGSSGTGANEFADPAGVAVSANGLTAWVADTFNDRISIWTRPDASSTNWTNQTTFGSAGGGTDKFALPFGVAVAANGLTAWVADLDNNRISVWGLVCPSS